jgi:hypothetical protein
VLIFNAIASGVFNRPQRFVQLSPRMARPLQIGRAAKETGTAVLRTSSSGQPNDDQHQKLIK